jgi:hypothetical protein
MVTIKEITRIARTIAAKINCVERGALHDRCGDFLLSLRRFSQALVSKKISLSSLAPGPS